MLPRDLYDCNRTNSVCGIAEEWQGLSMALDHHPKCNNPMKTMFVAIIFLTYKYVIDIVRPCILI